MASAREIYSLAAAVRLTGGRDGPVRLSGWARGGHRQDVAPRSQITLQPWGAGWHHAEGP